MSQKLSKTHSQSEKYTSGLNQRVFVVLFKFREHNEKSRNCLPGQNYKTIVWNSREIIWYTYFFKYTGPWNLV